MLEFLDAGAVWVHGLEEMSMIANSSIDEVNAHTQGLTCWCEEVKGTEKGARDEPSAKPYVF